MSKLSSVPYDVFKHLATFMNQSQLSKVTLTSKAGKSDMSPVLQQRQLAINQHYHKFFRLITECVDNRLPETDFKSLLAQLKPLVKTNNPNVLMRNGHSPLYNFIKRYLDLEKGLQEDSSTCKSLRLFYKEGIRIFIENGTNPNGDHYLIPLLLNSNTLFSFVVDPTIYKKGSSLVIKESDVVLALKKTTFGIAEMKLLMGQILYNIDNGLYPFDFNRKDSSTEGLNFPQLVLKYRLLDLAGHIRYSSRQRWMKEYRYYTQLVKEMNKRIGYGRNRVVNMDEPVIYDKDSIIKEKDLYLVLKNNNKIYNDEYDFGVEEMKQLIVKISSNKNFDFDKKIAGMNTPELLIKYRLIPLCDYVTDFIDYRWLGYYKFYTYLIQKISIKIGFLY